MTLLSLLQLVVLGFGAGALGTLVGAGGGFLMVPFLLFIWPDVPAQQIIGTSLAAVFLNGVSGTIAYAKQKKVYYDAAIKFTLATLPGAFLGSYASNWFSTQSFQFVFGVLLGIIALSLFFRARKEKSEASDFPASYNQPFGIAISFVIGFISSILGIGGGIIHVPAMVGLLGFTPHVATATSHFVLAFSALFGTVTHFMLGHVLIVQAIALGIGIIPGAQLGAKLSKRAGDKLILYLLAFILLSVAIRLLLSSHTN